MPSLLVISELNGSQLTIPTLEVCQAASELSDSLGGSWSLMVHDRANNEACNIAPHVFAFGSAADSSHQSSEEIALIASQIIDTFDYVLMAATSSGKDMMGRLAQLLNAPLAQDCTGFQAIGDKVLFSREMHGGKVAAKVYLSGQPNLVSFRTRSFSPIPRSDKFVDAVLYTQSKFTPKTIYKLNARVKGERPDVTEASIVVSGGRGLGAPENWYILEDLLDAFGPNSALACSRPVSDANWRPHHEHVGQTGRTIAPDLYIPIGISGATQHVAGIARSRCILAINKDPDAPIFQIADYGIVGDLFEVVPQLAKAIRDASP